MTPILIDQYGRTPVYKHIIRLDRSTRQNGEYLERPRGKFLRIESCDFPARISFNKAGIDESVPCAPGATYSGEFAGLTLWHDDFSAAGGANAILRISCSEDGSHFHDTDTTTGVAQKLVEASQVSNTTDFQNIVAVPYGFRELSLSFIWRIGSAAAPPAARVTVAFVTRTQAVISSANYTRDAVGLVDPNGLTMAKILPFLAQGGTSYGLSHTFDPVAIPSRAAFAVVAGNITVAGTGTLENTLFAFAR